jgi:hypothetical protein
MLARKERRCREIFAEYCGGYGRGMVAITPIVERVRRPRDNDETAYTYTNKRNSSGSTRTGGIRWGGGWHIMFTVEVKTKVKITTRWEHFFISRLHSIWEVAFLGAFEGVGIRIGLVWFGWFGLT